MEIIQNGTGKIRKENDPYGDVIAMGDCKNDNTVR
jgi:hypothetical protein